MKIVLIILGAILAAMSLLLIIVMPVAGIIGVLMGIGFIIYGIKYKKPDPEPAPAPAPTAPETIFLYDSRHTILVAGFDHHQKELKSLLTEKNPMYGINKKEWIDEYMLDFDECVYEYEKASYPLHLKAEPDNPYDPEAVQVFAGDTFVGYVPRGMFPEVTEYSAIENVRVKVEVFGGKYQHLEHDYEEDYLGTHDDKYYRMVTGSTPVKAIMVFEW